MLSQHSGVLRSHSVVRSRLLEIDFVREVPEAMKPRRIEITSKGNGAHQVIEGKANNSTDTNVEQLKRA